MSTPLICRKGPDIYRRVLILRKCIRFFLNRMCIRPSLKPRRVLSLPRGAGDGGFLAGTSTPPTTTRSLDDMEKGLHENCSLSNVVREEDCNKDSDLVSLKICLMGDPHIGKTSFLTKYGGGDKDQVKSLRMGRLNKVQYVEGARLLFDICEIQGEDENSLVSCKESVAMLFMFDLTSRCTLNNVVKWYQEATKWNQTSMTILIGTKFDDFVQLPMDIQLTIANQARAYAKRFNATLFFSSSTYNINVNKVFKFITARLFNLPWSLERNLTTGEPIIDF